MISIDAAFDGGNIEVLRADGPADIRLAIRKDTEADFYQWFSFRVSGARGVDLALRIENAGGASYPRGWEDYRAVASTDRRRWLRVPTEYAGGALTIRHRPESDAVHYAYFAPYSLERHADLVARCQAAEGVALSTPGTTALGRPINILRFGEPDAARPSIWAIARQHPGETMAEWFMEGFLDRLIDAEDGAARALRERAAIHAVPNMNPDGSALGNLRVNSLGANLNREWEAPSLGRSPEVFHVREAMRRTGVDLCLDVHGDEAMPYNFIVGLDGIAEASPAQRATVRRFAGALADLNPDFQTARGYPPARPGQGLTTTCTGWLGKHLGAASMTLEMPFKDAANAPDERVGWSPGRAMALGRSSIEAMLAVMAYLPLPRGGGEG